MAREDVITRQPSPLHKEPYCMCITHAFLRRPLRAFFTDTLATRGQATR